MKRYDARLSRTHAAARHVAPRAGTELASCPAAPQAAPAHVARVGVAARCACTRSAQHLAALLAVFVPRGCTFRRCGLPCPPARGRGPPAARRAPKEAVAPTPQHVADSAVRGGAKKPPALSNAAPWQQVGAAGGGCAAGSSARRRQASRRTPPRAASSASAARVRRVALLHRDVKRHAPYARGSPPAPAFMALLWCHGWDLRWMLEGAARAQGNSAPPPPPVARRCAAAAMACQRWVAKEFGGPAALSLETGPLPLPGKGEVRVRVSATTATYTDLLVLRGSDIPKVRAVRRATSVRTKPGSQEATASRACSAAPRAVVCAGRAAGVASRASPFRSSRCR